MKKIDETNKQGNESVICQFVSVFEDYKNVRKYMSMILEKEEESVVINFFDQHLGRIGERLREQENIEKITNS